MGLAKRIGCVVLTASFLSGCTMLGTYMSPQNPAPSYNINGHVVRVSYVSLTPNFFETHPQIHNYRIGPYDILSVIVWNHPNLTTPTTQMATPRSTGFLVDSQGNMSFPFAGTFHVAGL